MCLTEPRGIRRAALSGNLAWQNSCFRQKMSFRRIVVEVTEVCVKGSGLLGSCRGERAAVTKHSLLSLSCSHTVAAMRPQAATSALACQRSGC